MFLFDFFSSCSFLTDYQLVLDARIQVSYADTRTPNTVETEMLHPNRHQMTLPINGLNNYFRDCEVAFNHHTKLDTDRYNNKSQGLVDW